MTTLIHVIAQIVTIEPVLIAPQGEHFHKAPVVFRTFDGPHVWAETPMCGSHGATWLAVEPALAVLLGRTVCGRCWRKDRTDQTSIVDVEIPNGGNDDNSQPID